MISLPFHVLDLSCQGPNKIGSMKNNWFLKKINIDAFPPLQQSNSRNPNIISIIWYMLLAFLAEQSRNRHGKNLRDATESQFGAEIKGSE